MLVFVSFVVFSTLFYGANTASNATGDQPDVVASWIEMDNTFKESAKSAIKYLVPKILESSDQLNLSAQCMQQSFKVVNGIKNLEIWAFSFLDSSAKLTDGFLTGMASAFGEYDECLEIVAPLSEHNGKIPFQGQYCMTELRFPLPPKTKRYRIYDRIEELRNLTGTELTKFLTKSVHLTYYMPTRMGFCIPSGCTKADLNNILSLALGKIYPDINVSYCETKKEYIPFYGIQIFAIVFICFLISLVIVGSWVELHSPSKLETPQSIYHRVLLSFSAISNFKRLVSTKSSMENFRCLHGIRFFTIAWVVYGHAYLFPAMHASNYKSLFRMTAFASAPLAQVILNGSETVDVFFCIAGMLVSYFTINRVKLEKKKFNLLLFVLHRLFRVVPVTYFIILISFLIPLTGSGPIFQDVMQSTFTPCFQDWWKNTFLINNFYYSDDMCLRHTWYVSCDFQLYLMSIIVIIPLISSEKIGLTFNGLIILLSIAYTGTMTYVHDLAPTITHTHMNPDDEYVFFRHSYANVLSRAGPYFVGVLTGYILVTKPHIKMSKKIQAAGWIVATVSSGMVIFATALWHNVRRANALETLMYAALYKVAFAVGIAWMTFCCITGHGGFVNTFLSWKVWMPLSKLVFLTYLIEPMLQITYIANFKSTQEFTHFHFAVQFAGFLCISMLLALLCNLLVESPFLGLEKVLFESRKERDPNDKDDEIADAKKVNGNPEMASETGVDNKCFTRC